VKSFKELHAIRNPHIYLFPNFLPISDSVNNLFFLSNLVMNADDIDLSDPIWDTAAPIVIPGGRIVGIRADLDTLPDLSSSLDALATAGGRSLNLSSRDDVFIVEGEGALVFSGVYATGTPPQVSYRQQPPGSEEPLPYGLGLYPSVKCASGCIVSYKSGIDSTSFEPKMLEKWRLLWH
jgi:hypothetical protein